MKKMVCETCLFCAKAAAVIDLKERYECRRYPPSAVVVNQPNGPSALFMLPVVELTDYCGEHLQRPLTDEVAK